MCMCVYVCVCVYSRTLVVFYVITRQNMDLLFDMESVSVIEKRRIIQDFSFYEEDFCFSFLIRISVVFYSDYLCVNMWRAFPLGFHSLSNAMR